MDAGSLPPPEADALPTAPPVEPDLARLLDEMAVPLGELRARWQHLAHDARPVVAVLVWRTGPATDALSRWCLGAAGFFVRPVDAGQGPALLALVPREPLLAVVAEQVPEQGAALRRRAFEIAARPLDIPILVFDRDTLTLIHGQGVLVAAAPPGPPS